jgi:D-arabinose 1-dehydrogenase-like Zn-dependent alcohol dehydrogenase
MKAITVFPGQPNTVHLTEVSKPSLDQFPNRRGVLVKVLRVGVDGTDKEINAAEYGAAPPGYDYLIIGHEGFGRVEQCIPKINARIQYFPTEATFAAQLISANSAVASALDRESHGKPQ